MLGAVQTELEVVVTSSVQRSAGQWRWLETEAGMRAFKGRKSLEQRKSGRAGAGEAAGRLLTALYVSKSIARFIGDVFGLEL